MGVPRMEDVIITVTLSCRNQVADNVAIGVMPHYALWLFKYPESLEHPNSNSPPVFGGATMHEH